jgi:type II secretory pathway pseudopilin PulG
MKAFTKNEVKMVSLILLFICIFTLLNLQVSLRRARDSQRRSDIGAIADALDKYQKEFGFFPPSTPDGKILACKGENFGPIPSDVKDSEKRNYFFKLLRGCDWGKDSLTDVNDDSYQQYLKVIPGDSKQGQGYSYLYVSNTNRYQLYAYLEGGNSEIGYRTGIVQRNLKCGDNVCNFGKAYGKTPLEKSLEEYENEIRNINEE